MKKRILLMLSLLFLLSDFSYGTGTLDLPTPSKLYIKGINFVVKELKDGSKPFLNRDMSYSGVPADMIGWDYTQLNASSSYLPGPAAVFSIKALTDGFIYALVEDKDQPAACTEWATANGWTPVQHFSGIKYGTNKNQTAYLYQKVCKADEWVDIVHPKVFSQAILCTPSLLEENKLNAMPVHVEAGILEVATLTNGAPVFLNRTYTFENVPASISGLSFTRFSGGGAPNLTVTAPQSGDVFVCFSVMEPEETLSGWTRIDSLAFHYNDTGKTGYCVYKKAYTSGEVIRLKQKAWAGAILLSTAIDYTRKVNVTAPPGIVVHNSPAETHKYVGSPSIVIMPDGTYVASHDYFGNILSDSYVYNSVDKGVTWKRTAMIPTLNWSTLFNRGDELYLIGVAPKCTMGYGDFVVLKSADNGTTWTKPLDATSGLIKQGYYHCAPVPIVSHKGKLWRAMENMGANEGWGPFSALMTSIDEKADLLNATNWQLSNELCYNSAWKSGTSAWLEGNAVIDPDGNIKDILRVAYGPDDVAAVVSVSADGKTVSFDPEKEFICFPGAAKKFTIRYDAVSKRYWSLTNFVLQKDRYDADNASIRNTQVLMWSDDLRNWCIKDTILTCDNPNLNGFQYVDWQFDGEDIVFVSRTAWEDATGNPPRQHDANFLTFHRITKFRYERVAISGVACVKSWFGGAKSALALTFDDGFKGHYDYAFSVLTKYNIPATFFVNPGNLVKNGTTPVGRYGIWEEFAEMAAHGQEIASHTQTHPNLTQTFDDELVRELVQSKEDIEANILSQKCLTLAYPYCLHDEVVDQEVAKHYLSARQCGRAENKLSLAGKEWFSVNSDLLTWLTPRSLANEQKKAESVLASIRDNVVASGGFGVYCIHEVVPFDRLGNTDSYEPCTTEWLDLICQSLSAAQVAGNIWPATFSDITRYAQERDHLRMYTLQESEDDTWKSVSYAFTDGLDDTIFTQALTVEINLPSSWKEGKVYLNDQEVAADAIGNNSVILNIIPDKDTVTLKQSKSDVGLHVQRKEAFSFSPNPFSDELTISSTPDSGAFLVRVLDLGGKEVYEKRYSSAPALLKLGHLAQGTYLVSLYQGERKIQSEKIIISR